MMMRKSHFVPAAALIVALAAGIVGAETFEQSAANAVKDAGLKAQFTALQQNLPAEPVMSVEQTDLTDEAQAEEADGEVFADQQGGRHPGHPGGGHPGGGQPGHPDRGHPGDRHPGNPGHPGDRHPDYPRHPGNPGHPGGGHGPDRDHGRHGDGHRAPDHRYPGHHFPHNDWGRYRGHHGWGGYWHSRGYYWGWNPYGHPLWWGWTIWYPAYGSCYAHYERQYNQCNEAAQTEYNFCVSECYGNGECYAQCGTNLNYARMGCQDERQTNERLYCRY